MAEGTEWEVTQQTFIQKGQTEAPRLTRVTESSDVSWGVSDPDWIRVPDPWESLGPVRNGSMLLGFISLSH